MNRTTGSARRRDDDARSDTLRQRVAGEFLEMPGLRLSLRQAMRLWNLDEETCVRLLTVLVDDKFLRRNDHGEYVRLAAGDEWSEADFSR